MEQEPQIECIYYDLWLFRTKTRFLILEDRLIQIIFNFWNGGFNRLLIAVYSETYVKCLSYIAYTHHISLKLLKKNNGKFFFQELDYKLYLIIKCNSICIIVSSMIISQNKPPKKTATVKKIIIIKTCNVAEIIEYLIIIF